MLAPSGWGKSYLAAKLAPLLAPSDRQICVGPVPYTAQLLGRPWHNLPTPDKGPKAKEETNQFFRNLNASNEHFLVILDETDLYMSSQAYSIPELREYVNVGRNFGHGIICIARGSSEVSKNLLGTADLTVWGRVSEPNAIDWAKRYMRHAIPDVETVLSELKPHRFLVFAPQSDPQYQGFLTVIGGRIVTWEPTATSESNVESEDRSAGDTASVDGAEERSRTDEPPTSAPSTTSKSDESTSDSTSSDDVTNAAGSWAAPTRNG